MGYAHHTFILKNDGTLWGCGYNGYGQLGLGDTTNKNAFTQIVVNTNNIKSIHCGWAHTIILKNDGTLWACGWNELGQLGLGDTTNRKTLTQITTNVDNIKEVYCTHAHTIILKNDGTLWACGNNQYGQLGLGDTTNRKTFTQVTINTDNIKSVCSDGSCTFILKNDGTLWACGNNQYGQLGLGDTTNRKTFTQVTINTDNIKSIYCGGNHSFILKNDGTLWGCGWNEYGQLGLGDTTNRKTFTQITTNVDNVKLVNCGYYYTIIVKNDNTLWGCGNNSLGQLGLGDTINRNVFTKSINNIDNIKLFYNGGSHNIILEHDGTLWSCGWNEYGQLGLNNNNNIFNFTQNYINTDDIKRLPNQYEIVPPILQTYDLNTGLVETLDTNNFRNIPVNKFEKIKVLCNSPENTYLNCLISFDKKQTWKTFNGMNWTTISDITPNNILLNGMNLKAINELNKNKLITGGFTGDIDFLIAMKTNDVNKTPSITKIYIQYKK